MRTNPIARVGVTRVTSSNELQQLDEDLAAGRLTYDEYVRRRNELQPDVEHTDRSPSSIGPANDESQPASPFPPAFRWEASPPNETTQVIRPVTPDADAGDGGDMSEATQVVPKLDEQDSERTQVVQARPQPPPSYSSVHQAQPDAYQEPPDRDWTTYPVDTSAPPWAVSDLPPIADQQSAWMRQGPESFEAPADQPRTKQIVGIALVAVLVLALVGAGVAYVLSQDTADQAGGNQPPPQAQPQQPPRELPAPPPPGPPPTDTVQALIEPPGQPRAGGGLFDLPRLQSDELLPVRVVSALSAAGMSDGVLKASTRVESTIGMFAFTVRDEQAAIDVANTIADVQRNGGLQEDQGRAQQGVTVLGTAENSPSTVYRAVYVLYDRVIFLEVFGSSRSTVLANFDSLLEEQVNFAPPTVRR